MSLIKKKFSLNDYIAYDKVLDNKTLKQIEEYNNILLMAQKKHQEIVNNAMAEKRVILANANQQAQEILYTAQQTASENLEKNTANIENMLAVANEQVQDIILNSKQRASEEIWDKANDLLQALNQEREQFYTHTFDLIEDTIKAIIKKLTTNLDVQDKMHVLVNQLFEKAKEVQNATLFFNPDDFDNLPSLHIPQNWCVEKDITMDKGWCRLVGAGGEWKTSIALIERKIIQSLNVDLQNNIVSE